MSSSKKYLKFLSSGYYFPSYISPLRDILLWPIVAPLLILSFSILLVAATYGFGKFLNAVLPILFFAISKNPATCCHRLLFFATAFCVYFLSITMFAGKVDLDTLLYHATNFLPLGKVCNLIIT